MSSKKDLIIVESPTKARTIAGFLDNKYVVKSSFGHIRDLPKKGMSIDVEHNFKPDYEVPDDKAKVVKELKKLADNSATVWLASDEDREGESIAWHLSEVLGLKPANTKRIVFHEITETGFKAALAHPRNIDINLVDAQQARRILDRLVGYELSPVLWKKIQPKLSAGRVQSVAVRLIVEREREISGFKQDNDFKITAQMVGGREEFSAELNKRLAKKADVLKFLLDCQTAAFAVADISEKPSVRNPSPPFTTSTLQQEAARKLGFSVKQTMTLAQKLYENGHITYMRTDSLNLSETAISAAARYINEQFGANYYKARHYRTTSKGAQEAHEAIRPTNLHHTQAGDDGGQQKLYQLIWRRMLASQMAPAKTLKTIVGITISGQKYLFVAKGEVLQFDGYIKVYGGGHDDAILPLLKTGDELQAISITAHQTFSRPPARYSEAGLVKKLEELGIGRPSTYAPTVSTIQSRGYVEKADLEGEDRQALIITLVNGKIDENTATERYGADKDKLIPTHLAEVTTDFLMKYFESVVEYGFTAEVEKQLDRIAEGEIVWQDTLKDFYKRFHPLIGLANSASRQETSKARLIGQDPTGGQPIYVRYGRYGPMLQKGEVVEGQAKPLFAPMPDGVKMDDITLEQALKMFGLPRSVGKTADGLEIVANIGRFGPYILVNNTFVSIKPLDPFSISESKARELYAHKLELAAKRHIKNFDGSDVQVLRGPYGPFVTDGKKNARIPKALKPEDLSLEDAKGLLKNSKPARRRTVKRRP